MPPRIEPARADDADGILRLLELHHLPAAGLTDHLQTALVARMGGRIVGSVALEVYVDGALLRSVAVAPEQRGTGVGQALTREAIRLAEKLGMPALFLLTTTAERFFPKFGFEAIDRRDVPAGVQRSVEFTSACPATAIVMRKSLSAAA
jgi:amino-acid N-acetyltransferase